MSSIRRLLLSSALLIGATHVSAATVDVLFNAEIGGSAIERTVDNGLNWYSTDISIFQFQQLGGQNLGLPSPYFYAFCIEPREFVMVGSTYTYDVSALENGATNIGGMGAAKADELEELFGRFYPVFGAPLTSTQAGALQAAAWEIVRETTGVFDVLDGTTRFRNPADPNLLPLAQTYLNALDGTGPRMQGALALTLVGTQDVIIQSQIPEPMSFVLVGTALVMLGLARKRANAAAAHTQAGKQ